MSGNYEEKVRAALLVLHYCYSQAPEDMERAAVHLEKSLEIYRKLAQRTTKTYMYANTLQTGHRRIPIRGWKDDVVKQLTGGVDKCLQVARKQSLIVAGYSKGKPAFFYAGFLLRYS